MKTLGRITVFPSPREAATTLRRLGFKPASNGRGKIPSWKRVDPQTHHLITATTEVTRSGKIRVTRIVSG